MISAAHQPVALITGGGRGLGLACARRLADNGSAVVIVDRNERSGVLRGCEPERRRAKAPCSRGRCDRSREHGKPLPRMPPRSSASSRRCSCKWGGHPFPHAFHGDLRKRVAFGRRRLADRIVHRIPGLVLPRMLDAGFGRIVNFSSTAGKNVSTLGGAHYTAAKAGVLGLTPALANEMARFGITVNAICPGLFDTDMARENCTPERLAAYADSFPVGRLGEPEEVAALVAFICSPRCRLHHRCRIGHQRRRPDGLSRGIVRGSGRTHRHLTAWD